MSEAQHPSALLLSDDLIFTSRVVGTGRMLNLSITAALDSDRLLKTWETAKVGCIILDLQNPGLDVAALTQQLREASQDMPFVVAYGSHVDTATLKKARDAGCDVVVPRSKFVEDLPTALPDWCAGRAMKA